MHHWGFAALALALSLPASPAHVETSGKVLSIVEVPGIPNFHQVNDHVFRGGQPAAEAWPGLAKLGVKTVIDLRREDEHSTAAEAKDVAAAGMKYVNLPMKGVVAPASSQIEQVLALLNSARPGLCALQPRFRPYRHCYRVLPYRARPLGPEAGSERGQVFWYGMGPTGPKALRHGVPTHSVTHHLNAYSSGRRSANYNHWTPVLLRETTRGEVYSHAAIAAKPNFNFKRYT